MSGVTKSVKKVFSGIAKVVKKIWKPVLIAVAVYFTAGLALSAMPATSTLAASLPGFAGGGVLGTGLGAGATAGTGVFSSAANAIGLGGGLLKGATAAGTSALELGGVFGTKAALAAAAPNAALVAGSASGIGGMTAAATTAMVGGPAAGMSLTDKLLFSKMGIDVAGALFGPDPRDIARAEAEESAKWRGAFYGMDASGAGAMPPPAQAQAQSQIQSIAPKMPEIGALPKRPKQGSQDLFQAAETEMQDPSSQSYGQGQMKQRIRAPDELFAPAPGVRYV